MAYDWMDPKNDGKVTAAQSSGKYSWMNEDAPVEQPAPVAQAPARPPLYNEQIVDEMARTPEEVFRGIASPIIKGIATIPETVYNVGDSVFNKGSFAEGWFKGAPATLEFLKGLEEYGIHIDPETEKGKKLMHYVESIMAVPIKGLGEMGKMGGDVWNQLGGDIDTQEARAGGEALAAALMAGAGLAKGKSIAEAPKPTDGLTPSQRLLKADEQKSAERAVEQPIEQPVETNAYAERALQEPLPDDSPPVSSAAELQQLINEISQEKYVTTQKAPDAPVERTVTPSDLGQRAEIGGYTREAPKDWRTLVEEKLAEQVPVRIEGDMTNFKTESRLSKAEQILNEAKTRTAERKAQEDTINLNTSDLGLKELKDKLSAKIGERDKAAEDFQNAWRQYGKYEGDTKFFDKQVEASRNKAESLSTQIRYLQEQIDKLENTRAKEIPDGMVIDPVWKDMREIPKGTRVRLTDGSVGKVIDNRFVNMPNNKKLTEFQNKISEQAWREYEAQKNSPNRLKPEEIYDRLVEQNQEQFSSLRAGARTGMFLPKVQLADGTVKQLLHGDLADVFTGPSTIDMNSFGSWMGKKDQFDYKTAMIAARDTKLSDKTIASKLEKGVGPQGKLIAKSLTQEQKLNKKVEDMKLDPNKTPEQLKNELFDDQGQPLYQDMKEWQLGTSTQISSAGYLSRMHPVARDVVAKVYDAMNTVDQVYNNVLWGKSDVGVSWLRTPKREKTAEGALTEFSEAPEKVQAKVVDVAFAIDRETTLASKAGKEVAEVSDAALREKGLNEREIYYYRKLRGGLDKAFDILNEAGYEIGKIPNYIMHMWDGPYRAWVYDAEGKPVAVFGVDNKFRGKAQAEKAAGMSFAENGLSVKIEPVNKRSGNLETADLEALFSVMRSPDVRSKVIDSVTNALESRGFAAHTFHRKGYEGYQGTYGTPAQRVQAFTDGYQILLRSAIRKAEQLKAEKKVLDIQKNEEIAKTYPNALKAGLDYFDTAFGANYKWADTINDLADWGAHRLGTSLEGLRDVQAGINKFFMFSKVMVLNARMYAAQALQPEAYVVPRMSQYVSRFDDASVAKAYVKSMKDFLTMPDEIKTMVNEVAQRGALDTGQLREVEIGLKQAIREHSHQSKKDVVDFGKMFAMEISGIRSFQRLEAQSRLRASIMIYNALKGQFKGKELYDIVANETNDAMIDYRQHARAQAYNRLGESGTLVAPLTTFKHGALSQFVEYIKNAKNDREYLPLSTFIGSQVVIAGMMGTILLKEADLVIGLINSVRASYGYGPLPNATQTVMKYVDNDSVKWGLLSGMTNQNFSASMAFPSFVGDTILQAPVLSAMGDAAGHAYDAVGDLVKQGELSDKTQLNIGRTVLPGSLQGLVEKDYMERQGTDVVPDRNMQGTYRRTPEEQNMRSLLNAQSIKESQFRQSMYEQKQREFFYTEAKAALLSEMVSTMDKGKKLPDSVWEQAAELGVTRSDIKRALKRKYLGQDLDYEERNMIKKPTNNMIRRYQEFRDLKGE